MTSPDPERHLAELVQIRDAARQRAYISEAGVVPAPDLVQRLSEKIREIAWKDPPLAEALAESNLHLASRIDTPGPWAYATRSRAQVLHAMRKCAEAQPLFERAVQLFTEVGLDAEAGRTMVTEMENLAYLGRYDEAVRLEAPARAALEKAQDSRYLGHIETSLGNLHYRLKNFSKSLAHYESARALTDNPTTIAAIGMGQANVLTEMNRFDEALDAFKATREHCEQHGLPLWVDIVDRNMSRFYLNRGNYTTALQMLDQIRRKHLAAGDSRRVGLCDIDRAEIYLQLNLFQDASAVAGRAVEVFEKLGNRYESALLLTFKGNAEFNLMNDDEAQAAFDRARELFVSEGNENWVARVDLWRAKLLIRQQRFAEAGQLARRSAELFERQDVPVRAASARVLLALSLQQMHETASAIADAERALQELAGFHAPMVSYEAFNTLGTLKQLEGDKEEAERLYLRAISEIEMLRGNIGLDELRMSFGKDKYQVYENMVSVKLDRADTRGAFDFVERSKSRTLIDSMDRNPDVTWGVGSEDSPRSLRVRKVQEELNILYGRLSEVGTTMRVAVSNTETKDEIARREQELKELLRESESDQPGWAILKNMPPATVSEVQAMLDPEELLVEYYAVGEWFKAFVVGHDSFHVLNDVFSATSARASLRGLNFQLSKFHLNEAYIRKHEGMLLAATRHHLHALYAQLIEPIAHLFREKKRLVIVPHQLLHYVPFHALFDGKRYLVETCELSYAASASVLKICRSRSAPETPGRDLILAVADELTPHIHDEVAALRELLPDADVFVGAEAGSDTLRKYAPSAGRIHIAAHGVFRADNPLFSSLRLGDDWLNFVDLRNLRLKADITTLSACETGMSAVSGGDELEGLAPLFLSAGTSSLVVSLWMVNDRSTAQMMRRFYKGLRDGLTKARALREAILEVKESFPHPYYWAPFMLLGKS